MDKQTDYFDHPIFDPLTFRLETRQIQQLREKITQWLWTGATGGYIQGISRTGKTAAFELIKDSLKFRSGIIIPGYMLSIPRRDTPTIHTIFKNCCYNAQLLVKTRDSAEDLKNRFAHFLVDKANFANAKQIVLLVDEMQRLKARQFDAFAELYDCIRLMGISLVIVFIGNTYESDELVKQVKAPQFDHIRGRFFSQKSTFTGLQSASDLAFCLKQYDLCRYPLDTGPTYTQYFLPQLFEQGWRFENQSKLLWAVFREYQKIYDLQSWGMQYFTSTANTLLIDYLPRSKSGECTSSIVQECIELSGLPSSYVDLTAA